MEENSEVQMDIDVSSTTGDVPETQQAMGIHGNVETVIVVEEVKEEEVLRYGSPETSPTKSKNSYEAVITPTLSPEKDHSKKKVISPNKEVQIVYLNKPMTPPKSAEVNCTSVESKQDKKTPPKSEHVQKSPGKLEQAQRTPIKLVLLQKSPNKFAYMQEIPTKSDHAEKTPKKSDLVQRTTAISEPMTKTLPESEQSQKPSLMTEQVPKKLDQVEKPHINSECNKKSDQMNKTPLKSSRMPMTPNLSEQIETSSEHDHKKTDKVLQTPTNSDQFHRTPTKEGPTEQVQKTISIPDVHNKVDQVEKIQEISPTKSLEQQTSKNIVDITENEVAIKPMEVTEAVLEKSTKESKQSKECKESLKEQSEATPGKINLVNKSDSQTNKEKLTIIEKSPVKESLDNHNSNTDSENTEIKESFDKVKGNKKDKKKEDVISNTSMDICEKSNDSQLETNSDISEKDHNKSISRELKSLIKSAKESKLISECTQLTSKTRKSRAQADSTNTSLNASVEADKIERVRRSSTHSQKSNCSSKSEKTSLKRSMRSQNPEFVNKVKQFLNSVTGKSHKVEDEEEIDSGKKENHSGSLSPSPKKKKPNESQQTDTEEQNRRLRSDLYCWRCHWAVEQAANEKGHPPLLCTVCPRSFHYKCLSGTERNRTMTVKGWICPECMNILHAESAETQSLAMKKLNHPRLCELLQYAWDRMIDLNGVEPFMNPVDRTAFPDYDKYVIHPMDLSLMKKNITKGNYGSTEAFLADAQWILHNSIIFNTLQSKLTSGARALVRSCRAEMGEIEACPECYAAAHARRLTWFTDVCSTPHILLWAKLKGFPYWPAKGMSVNSQGLVDVRFFGAHDRAWVPARDCFLYCQKDPNNFKAKRLDILESMQEAEDHIRNISRKYRKFVYPAFKTPFDPSKLTEQLKMMIPTFEGELSSLVKEKTATSSPNAVKVKRRSNSRSRKNSTYEGDVSENEERKPTQTRNMADEEKITQEIDVDSTIPRFEGELSSSSPNAVKVKRRSKSRSRKNSTNEGDTPMEIDHQSVQNTEKESTKKRRRSALEEAVITIINACSNEKKKKVDNEKVKDSKKAESTQEISEKTKETLPNNTENETKIEKAKNKVNEREVSTPTISKEGDVDIPGSKVEKAQVFTSTPVKKIKPIKTSTPKEKQEKTSTPKQKAERSNKSQIEKEKQDQAEKEKQEKKESIKSRRRSKSRCRSLPKSSPGEKGEKTVDKNSEANTVSNNVIKDKVKEPEIPSKDKESLSGKPTEKANKRNANTTDSSKPVKDRLQFDDDTSLAVIARETAKKSFTRLPTISSVRSLSTTAQTTSTTTKSTEVAKPKTVEITVSAACALNVFTPTSTDNVRNMKEAVDKLQKLRNETDKPLVGRVGVRSFARMTSPPAPPEKDKSNETVEVEVKSEPMDFDDADRQVEKMDLMKAFHLRPVNPVTIGSLRDVRINKVVVAPAAKKTVTKPTEVRVSARKTFPSPRKEGNDGRSELNGKNSMVYIPIQPPTTQAPVQRPTRPVTINGGVNTQTVRPLAPNIIANSLVNTQTTPLVSVPMATSLAMATPKPTNTVATSSHSNAICVPSVGQIPSIGQVCQIPTVGQIPTTVHTVPLITSVNGQWTFSLQPMMSVGGDGSDSSPVVNGLAERSAPFIPGASSNQLAILPTTQLLAKNNNTTSHNGENTPAELPRLQQRPPLLNPLDPSAGGGAVPAPSTAGPITAKLSQNAVKLADFFRTLLEDSLEKIDDPLAQATLLKAQLEQAKWKHQQEVVELKHTHELLATEMRVGFEKEKARALGEMRRVAQVELEAAVKAAKTKQWCANCSQEAQFYCCWNTSYCDYTCQRSHWSQHFAVCTQQRNTDNNPNENGNSIDKRLQPAPENLPALQRSAAAPALAPGTKLAPTRVYAQEPAAHKQSIIVSMVEDPSGNQMVKCVGTYKPPGAQHASPLILNKQLLNNDENTAKKVMTSGGYLIVGAGNNAPLATNRRTHPVQYTYNT